MSKNARNCIKTQIPEEVMTSALKPKVQQVFDCYPFGTDLGNGRSTIFMTIN